MTPEQLHQHILRKRSMLCVGLDSDPQLLPTHLRTQPDGVLTFNKAIIAATAPYAVAYKINTAFYEAQGAAGWRIMEETLAALPADTLRIADAKRGDIGNSSEMYARTFFDTMAFDAITVSPYMGHDSVQPFLARTDKWTFMLGLTSNTGAADYQLQPMQDGQPLYAHAIRKAEGWPRHGQLGYVVGATRPDYISKVRHLAPQAFLLVPGVGSQGGDLEAVCHHGMHAQVGLLINASRSILYASRGADFAEAAGAEAMRLAAAMAVFLPA